MKYLDKEEKNIIESYKKGEWVSAKKKDKDAFIKAAKESIKKVSG